MKILVTGGCGFIGSNFIRYLLKKYDYEIVNLDLLTYAGNLDNLSDIKYHRNYSFVRGDISNVNHVRYVFEKCQPNIIINFAAESHVDRSIENSQFFITTNIVGTQVLLDFAKEFKIEKFIQISTDEVYGSILRGKFTEKSLLKPSSPYSSSKASADLIALSYYITFGLNVVITRCSNNYGPFQYPEKFIPLLITNAFEGKKFPIYKKGQNIRDWIHVEDHCRAIDLIFHKGRKGEIYNIGANNERRNIDIAKLIANETGVEDVIEFVSDRLGHDFRYSINFSKITEKLGWEPIYDFESGIRNTIQWYKDHECWWRTLK